ncbi:MAG TPA: AzlD domain-containing protein [Hyphomicrobiaceae bacterium]|jgi:branched chain amino acid efflux pump|nr:AzlD domain-containing protein [Hyphomicrobiaceae bacterium]
MTTSADALTILAVMALAAAICRGGGFWLMRFVPITPRVRAALNAIPIAVLMGIMAPALLRGGIAESAAVLATAGVVKAGGNDLLAILAGLATVALLRQVM